jgi:hypothetical protein
MVSAGRKKNYAKSLLVFFSLFFLLLVLSQSGFDKSQVSFGFEKTQENKMDVYRYIITKVIVDWTNKKTTVYYTKVSPYREVKDKKFATTWLGVFDNKSLAEEMRKRTKLSCDEPVDIDIVVRQGSDQIETTVTIVKAKEFGPEDDEATVIIWKDDKGGGGDIWILKRFNRQEDFEQAIREALIKERGDFSMLFKYKVSLKDIQKIIEVISIEERPILNETAIKYKVDGGEEVELVIEDMFADQVELKKAIAEKLKKQFPNHRVVITTKQKIEELKKIYITSIKESCERRGWAVLEKDLLPETIIRFRLAGQEEDETYQRYAPQFFDSKEGIIKYFNFAKTFPGYEVIFEDGVKIRPKISFVITDYDNQATIFDEQGGDPKPGSLVSYTPSDGPSNLKKLIAFEKRFKTKKEFREGIKEEMEKALNMVIVKINIKPGVGPIVKSSPIPPGNNVFILTKLLIKGNIDKIYLTMMITENGQLVRIEQIDLFDEDLSMDEIKQKIKEVVKYKDYDIHDTTKPGSSPLPRKEVIYVTEKFFESNTSPNIFFGTGYISDEEGNVSLYFIQPRKDLLLKLGVEEAIRETMNLFGKEIVFLGEEAEKGREVLEDFISQNKGLKGERREEPEEGGNDIRKKLKEIKRNLKEIERKQKEIRDLLEELFPDKKTN